jgi:Dyp-type peroxidase family
MITQKLGKIEDNLNSIQGNIIGGFNKDYQTFLFLKFNNPDKGRKWLGRIATEIATSAEVRDFNKLFKTLKKRSGREGIVKATWTNIAFTHSGLHVLKVPEIDLKKFPIEFQAGLAARAKKVGDEGSSAPENWVGQLGSKDIHALLIVASDSLADLNELVDGYIKDPIFATAATVIFRQEGRTRFDDPGHEHFGFKDGVSQPGIRGVTDELSGDPNKGQGHEDLLQPGEFVLGYPTQIPHPDEKGENPNHGEGSISTSGPEWTKNGSYLVFRRLSQDVQAFNHMVSELAKVAGLDPAVMGAKLVGRYKSGAPLEQADIKIDPQLKDPSIADRTLLGDDKINDFEYDKDLDGHRVPRAAHIRKAYPRNQVGGAGSSSESETQTHRLLRRGIPFGNSLGAPEHGNAKEEFPHDRGLLFLAYQRSIADQFEFVQEQWVNDPNFPCTSAKTSHPSTDQGHICTANEPDGQDPIIAQSSIDKTFRLPSSQVSGCPVHTLDVKHFVTTTGGEYFFQPSIEAIYQIACENPPAT